MRYCERHGDQMSADSASPLRSVAGLSFVIHGEQSPMYCLRCVAALIDANCCILTNEPLDPERAK